MLSQREIDALPTILDVVERLSKMENDSLLKHNAALFPGDAFQDEGRYAFVSETWNRNVVRLMPVSATPYTYYRGQSRFYEQCVPSIFRRNENGELPSEVDIAYNRIKICEFERLLSTHPVFCELSHMISVNPVALAQHYGLTTEYLDITKPVDLGQLRRYYLKKVLLSFVSRKLVAQRGYYYDRYKFLKKHQNEIEECRKQNKQLKSNWL